MVNSNRDFVYISRLTRSFSVCLSVFSQNEYRELICVSKESINQLNINTNQNNNMHILVRAVMTILYYLLYIFIDTDLFIWNIDLGTTSHYRLTLNLKLIYAIHSSSEVWILWFVIMRRDHRAISSYVCLLS